MRQPFWYLFLKHFAISFLLGGLPTILFFIYRPDEEGFKIIIKNLSSSGPLQAYFIGGSVISVFLSLIVKLIEHKDSNTKARIVFLRDIFKEAISGLKNMIQATIGALFVLCSIWYKVEPQFFSFAWCGFYLLLGIIFLTFTSYIERMEGAIDALFKTTAKQLPSN